MNLDEQAINSVKEYFEAIAQNAVDDAYAISDNDVTFAQFMETLFQKINQFSAEHIAIEVLQLSSKAIENYNSGSGIYVDDVQELIDNYDDLEMDDDEVE
jgi:ketosteroid isomerase-like protein